MIGTMFLFKKILGAFTAGCVAGCVFAAAANSSATRIAIDDFMFKEASVTVPLGTTIVWENNDDVPHTVVGTGGEFRSRALDTRDVFSFTFNKAGRFSYFCSLHPHMKGEVVVQ